MIYSRFLEGLPGYFGGKQKLVKRIISCFNKGDNFTVVDAFCGGGSVSLWSKLNNYRVISNDHQYLSYQIQKSFIENNCIKLTKEDVLRLFNYLKQVNIKELPNYNKCQELFVLDQHARFVCGASYLVNKINVFKNEHKKSLFNILISRYCSLIRPYQNFTSSLNKKIMDNVNTKQSYEINSSSIKKTNLLLTNSLDLALNVMDRINKSVFNNGHKNECYNLDVFSFLNNINNMHLANTILYLDPPYYGCESYEHYYLPITNILLCENGNQKQNISVFNLKDYKTFFENLLTNSLKFNRLVISYAGKATESIIKLVEKYRKIEIIKIPVHYSVSGKDVVGCEYIIIGDELIKCQ